MKPWENHPQLHSIYRHNSSALRQKTDSATFREQKLACHTATREDRAGAVDHARRLVADKPTPAHGLSHRSGPDPQVSGVTHGSVPRVTCRGSGSAHRADHVGAARLHGVHRARKFQLFGKADEHNGASLDLFIRDVVHQILQCRINDRLGWF